MMHYRHLHLAILASLLLLTGCSVVGPASIGSGRIAYSQAITTTEQEQLLQIIVRNRYDEQFVPLAVSGVTANIRVTTNAGVNAGFGPSSNYAGNLVPFSAGVLYEENPIISYTPVRTPSYLRQLLTPVPLDLALPLLRSSSDRELVFYLLIERINSLKNPTSSESTDKDSFIRAIELLSDLFRHDLAEFVSLSDDEFGLLLQLEEIEQSEYQDDLIEILTLLELNDLLQRINWRGELPSGEISGSKQDSETNDESNTTREEDSDEKDSESSLAGVDAELVSRSERDILVIAIRFSAVADGSSIALTTRSIYDIVRIASSAIDVPEEHLLSGRARTTTGIGLANRYISIKRAQSRPAEATIATQHDGWWYYIDPDDARSKQFFRILGVLWSARLASSGRASGAPLLTVPVSR